MKERPILFSGPMVRAILAGTKTQTRRIVKPQPISTNYLQPMWGTSPDGVAFGDKGLWREVGPDYPDDASDDRRCPYGVPGDRLWVRETFCPRNEMGGYSRPSEADHVILADGSRMSRDGRAKKAIDSVFLDGLPWRPSIHMPRWASRITLEVTGVRVERLQSISVMEAMAEGVAPRPVATGVMSYTHGFRVLWDQINGASASWDTNPWVWVVSFARASREGGR